ncbi:hypothetical protein FJU30_03455 [Affinibrenneria salicis]|uniref:Uncharacterized protein n=1 Tax=Affinibrenneria salicis TaxID=2590031 RepID=A0A5J5G6F3_9GAMM|nr:hypothetical protein [Affinibrenneria salicis]KAA9002662.1 hypothetical protein FJU30_01310 [Affinibrenneria salicis]KAA9003051.1 hypothetical protein FJU30_03455 [Affinibrenneria salicis]
MIYGGMFRHFFNLSANGGGFYQVFPFFVFFVGFNACTATEAGKTGPIAEIIFFYYFPGPATVFFSKLMRLFAVISEDSLSEA